jgi:rhodanese-related sulfurtransferase
MDGDHASALASAGFGTDEDYGGGTHDWESDPGGWED